MDPASFVESIEDARRTELRRLGSSKLLIALTGADLEAGAVLRTVVVRAGVARERFQDWSADENVEDARTAFETAAAVQAKAVERVRRELDGSDADVGEFGAGDPFGGELQGLSNTVERAGGLVGWALVADRIYAQVVGFFVNEAAPARADLFRELRADAGAVREDAVDVLAAACDSDVDWERASGAAESVVRAAYDNYAETLDGMGLDPKPVC